MHEQNWPAEIADVKDEMKGSIKWPNDANEKGTAEIWSLQYSQKHWIHNINNMMEKCEEWRTMQEANISQIAQSIGDAQNGYGSEREDETAMEKMNAKHKLHKDRNKCSGKKPQKHSQWQRQIRGEEKTR